MTSLTLKIVLLAALALALVVGSVAVLRSAYEKGRTAGKNELLAAQAKEMAISDAKSLEKYAAIGKNLAFTAQQADHDLQKGADNVVVRIQTIHEVVHEHPDYGTYRRPAGAVRVRTESLQAVRDAIRGLEPAHAATAGAVAVP